LAKPSASRPAGPRRVVCDVSALAEPDLTTIDALARIALDAWRLGCQVQLRNASPELRELLALAGLADVVRCVAGSGVESRGETEEREELRGVEEERDPADAIAGDLDDLE
jgi:STAS domain-containing protein